MTAGKVEAIFIGPVKNGMMQRVEAVQAMAGRGLQGDRKAVARESSAGTNPDRELTLIEMEAIEALHRELGLEFAASESRRNIVTRGVALNHLVGRDFHVGSVAVRGIRLCEPCEHLESLTRPGVKDGLIHRGGLRAQILSDGEVRVGDPIHE
jgi:MOSC domain-containing protein YiiM